MSIMFKCHSCKCLFPIPKVGEVSNPTRFKWRDKTHMVQVQVCEDCWNKAKSLKVPEWGK